MTPRPRSPSCRTRSASRATQRGQQPRREGTPCPRGRATRAPATHAGPPPAHAAMLLSGITKHEESERFHAANRGRSFDLTFSGGKRTQRAIGSRCHPTPQTRPGGGPRTGRHPQNLRDPQCRSSGPPLTPGRPGGQPHPPTLILTRGARGQQRGWGARAGRQGRWPRSGSRWLWGPSLAPADRPHRSRGGCCRRRVGPPRRGPDWAEAGERAPGPQTPATQVPLMPSSLPKLAPNSFQTAAAAPGKAPQ